jgi:hypothetical protein
LLTLLLGLQRQQQQQRSYSIVVTIIGDNYVGADQHLLTLLLDLQRQQQQQHQSYSIVVTIIGDDDEVPAAMSMGVRKQFNS